MAWIDVLQQREAVWQEFKADLGEIITAETEKLLSKDGEELLVQKGKALMARDLLRKWTSKERDEYARAVRRDRETHSEGNREHITILGFGNTRTEVRPR